MGARRRARELALALLFQLELGRARPENLLTRIEATLDLMTEAWQMPPDEVGKLRGPIEEFARRLVEAYLADAAAIDARIAELAQGWSLERMPTVDRNVLRLALAEILHFEDVPIAASIDEAVDIAKMYSTEDSGKFVNGILGTLARARASA
jgi:N utilization substance protein B